MGKCVNCGRKLGLLGSYRHPTLGKNYLLCNSCFDTVYESVEKYRELISPNIGFFNKSSADNNQFDIINIPKQVIHAVKMFESIWTGKET